jgi:hypothetical protein
MAISNLKFGLLCCLGGFAVFSVIVIARTPNQDVGGNVGVPVADESPAQRPTYLPPPTKLKANKRKVQLYLPICSLSETYPTAELDAVSAIINCGDTPVSFDAVQILV